MRDCLLFFTRLLLCLPPLLLLLPQSVRFPAGSTLLVSRNDLAMERTLEERVRAQTHTQHKTQMFAEALCSCPVTLSRSCRWHSFPLPSGALQKWLTGVNLPGKEMYLLLLSASKWSFSTSSSTSAGTQNWCWEVALDKQIMRLQVMCSFK